MIMPDGEKTFIGDVLYVPGLEKNMISVSQITKKQMQVQFQNDKCTVIDKDHNVIAVGTESGGLYKLKPKPANQKALYSNVSSEEQLWHERMGHLNYSSLVDVQIEYGERFT